jgi:hypothetical protein
MKIYLEINKSAAVRAGLDKWGGVVLDVPADDLTPAQRETLIRSFNAHHTVDVAYNLHAVSYGNSAIKTAVSTALENVSIATIDTVRAVLDAIPGAVEKHEAEKAAHEAEKAAHEAEKAAREAAVLHELSQIPVEDLIRCTASGEWIAESVPNMRPTLQEALTYYRKDVRTEIDRRNEASGAAKKAAATDALRRENAAIAAWVLAHGSESRQERHAAGLLDKKEVLGAMHEDAFARFASFERYQKLEEHDTPCANDHDHDEHNVSFDVDTAKSLTDAEWVTFRSLRAEVGEAGTCEPREHTAICQYRSCTEPHDRSARRGALVTLVVGPFSFTRAFAL